MNFSSHSFDRPPLSSPPPQALTDYVKFYLQQWEVESGRPATVKVAAHLMRKICYQNKDNLSAGVIVAGWDPVSKGQVYNIPLGGTCIEMKCAIGGSGSTYIYGLTDALYKENMGKQVRGGDVHVILTSVLGTSARHGCCGQLHRRF